MSGIVGIYYLDGRPVDQGLLEAMTGAIAHRGRDGSGLWIGASVGMGHRMFHTTPESLFEKQPLTNESGQISLVLDGRVDNRDELKSSLIAGGSVLRDDTDAELVLRSYETWGEGCAVKLIGDFACAIWDGRHRRLFCARDFMGIRPFYYYFDGKSFLWSSEPHALFESPDAPRKPNEGMIAEYLTSYIHDVRETLYQGILRLPPAHYLVVDADGIRFQRYWDIDPSKSIRYASDEQYTEHFYDLFRESVRSKMRAVGPVASDLSGGLDSSSVVGMAQVLISENSIGCKGFETFSWVFPGRECDESSYIDDVISKWGLIGHKVEPHPARLDRFLEQVALYQDFPGYPNGATVSPLRPLARSRGCRVSLTGEGGDEWTAGTYNHYIDLLFKRSFRQAAREGYQSGGFTGSLDLLRNVIRVCVWPAAPRGLQRMVRALMRKPEVPDWIGREFARRTGLAERLLQEEYKPKRASYSQKERYSLLTCGWNVHSKEIQDRVNAYHQMEARHPLSDRRIVEFGLALPEEQRRRDGTNKFILRNAGRNLLPPSVHSRRDKAHFADMFSDQLRMLGGGAMFESLTIAGLGWVNADRVRLMYKQMEKFAREGFKGPVTYIWILWIIFGIDLWWRLVFERKNCGSLNLDTLPGSARISEIPVRQ